MDMAEIGANIRSCRTEKDMTMEELGKAIGKSQSAVADKVAREGKKSSWYCIQAMLEESNLGSQ